VISLGAGVQSSTLLLMAAEGAFGAVPELAIFADTPRAAEVYDHLDWLEGQVAGSIEIAGCPPATCLRSRRSRPFNPIPLYLKNGTARRRRPPAMHEGVQALPDSP
jgi:hypothetical protein